jgi:hypothetical protein
VGDHVVFGKYAGIKMKYQGVKLILVNDEDVKLLVDDPADLGMARARLGLAGWARRRRGARQQLAADGSDGIAARRRG